MGRKSRTKPQASELAARKKCTQPNEYFRHGPFEMARFGKHVLMRNTMTPAQHREYMKHQADRLPAVSAEIDAHVAAIVRIVESYDPLSLLQRGYWASVIPHMMPFERGGEEAGVVGQRMIDYIQSVVAAVSPKGVTIPPVTDADWGELSRHVEALFDTINHAYLNCRTADWKVNGGGPVEAQREFYVRAMAMWCNVTGHRYHFQEIDHLRELLAPHSAEFQRLWGIDAEGMVRGFGAILHSLSCGPSDAMERIAKAQEEYSNAEREAAGNDAIRRQQLDALRNDQTVENAFECLFGAGLFIVDQHLPKSLLDDLSWAPGECTDFIDGNPQSGWPTRIWPRSRRPFVHIGGSYYCFDVHTLFDHIYRVIERAVRSKDPGYSQTWNEQQKQVSESLPFRLLGKILPDARSWRSVYYEVDEVDLYGRKKWCELDGLLAYVDHLFIIEVKGGTFTTASPETGFESHLKSIERLIFAPVDQGTRFLQWLEKTGSVVLCDDQHRRIGEVARSDFAHVTVCAVSLDPFTELSAKAYHLRTLVGRQGTAPFWALSVSDLLTYSELFDNPLIFLHFVEKRSQATASSKVILDDELDHYGMYLKHNKYNLYAEEIAGESRINWSGYRAAIDQFFDARTRGENATVPKQEMPLLYLSIVHSLAESEHALRRRVASLLLDCDGETRTDIARMLSVTLMEQAKVLRPKPFSIGGKDTRITFVCWQPDAVGPAAFDAVEFCKAAMLAASEPDRWLIELFFDSQHQMEKVEPTLVSAAGLSETDRKGLAMRVDQLRVQRLNQKIAEIGKIGRNQYCPCGSGKKYKRCCGA